MEHLADEFVVAKSIVNDTMKRVENVLIQDGSFRLSGKKALLSPENAALSMNLVCAMINRELVH